MTNLLTRYGLIALILLVGAFVGSYSLAAEKALDPVCLVEVDKAKTNSYEWGGKVYNFCSEKCRGEFVKNPDKYGCICLLENCKKTGFDCAYFRGKEGSCQCYKRPRR